MNESNEKDRRPSQATSDAEIERDVRSRRKFSLAEAIGRSAGGLLHGASPVTRRRQAEFAIEEFLDTHLTDADGALGPVLLREVRESEALMASYDAPLTALGLVLDEILASGERLRRFVRDVDAEWGRMYEERPRFDVADHPPQSDDPYTATSVAESLRSLQESLAMQGTTHR